MSRSRRTSNRAKPLTMQHEPSRKEVVPEALARRDRRRTFYGGVDLVLAAVHALIITQAAPTRHGSGQVLLWSVVAAFTVAGGSTLLGRRPGWLVAAGACGFLLVIEIVFLGVIVMSASYLSGVFGAFGRGAAGISLAAAALSIQMIALVPVLQLKYLMTRAGRRAFGQAAAA